MYYIDGGQTITAIITSGTPAVGVLLSLYKAADNLFLFAKHYGVVTLLHAKHMQ